MSKYLIPNNKYIIISPIYEDYEEGLVQDKDNILVIKKTKNGYLVKNLDIDSTYELSFHILNDCEIKLIIDESHP